MVLPPPVTVPHDFPLPSTTRLSLKRLLMALGISPELLKKLDVGDEYESLRSFFIDAAEHVRWNEATDHTASQRLHNAKLVFKMSRQVHVGVGGECEKISASEQADLIEGLAWSLDRAESVDLGNQAIMIGGEGIDSSGRLWLPRGHSPEEWRRAILSADLEEMQRRKEHVDQVKAKEKSIAKRLGIDMIYTSDNIRSQNCYLTFLTDLGIMAEMSGCIISPDESHDLAVCVVSQEERDPDEALSIDSDLGFFRVPMDVDPARIYRYIQSNQEKAQSIKKRHTEHEAAMQELGQSVRQRLRLRKLHRDPLVSHAQFHKACYRLLRNASSFGDWTEGLYLRVSFANRLILQPQHHDHSLAGTVDADQCTCKCDCTSTRALEAPV